MSLSIAAFAVWYGRTTHIPDDMDGHQVSDLLVDQMLRDLNVSSAEKELPIPALYAGMGAVITTAATPPRTKRRGRHPDKALSGAFVRNAPPGRHSDGNGLYLFVQPTGTRSWIQRQVGSDSKKRVSEPERRPDTEQIQENQEHADEDNGNNEPRLRGLTRRAPWWLRAPGNLVLAPRGTGAAVRFPSCRFRPSTKTRGVESTAVCLASRWTHPCPRATMTVVYRGRYRKSAS